MDYINISRHTVGDFVGSGQVLAIPLLPTSRF